MAATVSLTINFRDGSSHTISQLAGQDNNIVQYDQLTKSLNYVQEQSNAILTTLVNQEKTQRCNSDGSRSITSVNSNEDMKTNNTTGNEGDETDDEEDNEDDDDTDKPSPEKKRKK